MNCSSPAFRTSLPANVLRVVRETRPCWKFFKERWMKKGRKTESSRRKALAALRKESDRALTDLIRRRLALPVEKRMNFLRVRLPGGGSAL